MAPNPDTHQQPSTPPRRHGIRLLKNIVGLFTNMTRIVAATLGLLGAVAAITITVTITTSSSAEPNPVLPRTVAPDPSPRLDSDGDSVIDARDNCDFVRNRDQANTNDAGRGDACDEDDDNDTVLDNAPDNCRTVANPRQEDFDSDGRGDACDNDSKSEVP